MEAGSSYPGSQGKSGGTIDIGVRGGGLGRPMICQLEAQRRFPCRVRIGARAVGWVEAEVQGWLTGRVERHRAWAST